MTKYFRGIVVKGNSLGNRWSTRSHANAKKGGDSGVFKYDNYGATSKSYEGAPLELAMVHVV